MMKAISTRTTKAVEVGSRLRCIDNTGAKELEVIAVKGFKGTRRKRGRAGVGDVVIASVKSGDIKMRHEMVKAVIVAQKKEYRRADGSRIRFAENTAVLVQDDLVEPRGKEIKGVVAKEVVERFKTIGKIASIIV